MREVMRLDDVMRRLASLDQDATIYAVEPWNADSLAVVEIAPESGRTPDELVQQGFAYFLEVFISREVLEDLELMLGAKPPTEQERCDRVISYAIYDA